MAAFIEQRTTELNARDHPPDLTWFLETTYDHHRAIGPTEVTSSGST
ncbi:hypothetical protein [Nonomuraea sp. NPDC050310]